LVDESSENRKLMNQRRQNKHTLIEKNIPLPEIIYNSDTALITWGSTKFIGREIANSLSISHIHFSYIYPFPSGLSHALSKFTKIFVLENNLTGQFTKLLRSKPISKLPKFMVKTMVDP
jgi:pyruvate/2-oxoacid:ferredoxin oxidoreductase alpha subunit